MQRAEDRCVRFLRRTLSMGLKKSHNQRDENSAAERHLRVNGNHRRCAPQPPRDVKPAPRPLRGLTRRPALRSRRPQRRPVGASADSSRAVASASQGAFGDLGSASMDARRWFRGPPAQVRPKTPPNQLTEHPIRTVLAASGHVRLLAAAVPMECLYDVWNVDAIFFQMLETVVAERDGSIRTLLTLSV